MEDFPFALLPVGLAVLVAVAEAGDGADGGVADVGGDDVLVRFDWAPDDREPEVEDEPVGTEVDRETVIDEELVAVAVVAVESLQVVGIKFAGCCPSAGVVKLSVHAKSSALCLIGKILFVIQSFHSVTSAGVAVLQKV
jgi:hypothetical protein